MSYGKLRRVDWYLVTALSLHLFVIYQSTEDLNVRKHHCMNLVSPTV